MSFYSLTSKTRSSGPDQFRRGIAAIESRGVNLNPGLWAGILYDESVSSNGLVESQIEIDCTYTLILVCIAN